MENGISNEGRGTDFARPSRPTEIFSRVNIRNWHPFAVY